VQVGQSELSAAVLLLVCCLCQAAASGGEPSGAIRAVNALLTQLDALRRFPNVMVLTTSNITEAIDVAFVDRADIKVPHRPLGPAAASCLGSWVCAPSLAVMCKQLQGAKLTGSAG